MFDDILVFGNKVVMNSIDESDSESVTSFVSILNYCYLTILAVSEGSCSKYGYA